MSHIFGKYFNKKRPRVKEINANLLKNKQISINLR